MTRNNRCIVDADRWIRCSFCGHKLGKVLVNTNHNDCLVEIKCHSCKTINRCHVNMNRRFVNERN